MALGPPVGTVTFLFTDIEGSTRRWQEAPAAMATALQRHHELLQRAIDAHRGYVFQIVGDAFCAAFQRVRDAAAAALDAQRALGAEPWPQTGPVRVRMALHTGAAEIDAGRFKSGEYVSSLTLSRTARLLAAAHGGQIVVSQASEELLHDDLPPAATLRDLGRHRLRDLTRAEHVFQLTAPDLSDVYPALRTLDAVPNNLPVQTTTFIGREAQVADAVRLLGETRLLTITGPGGTGKTRLSLEVAAGVLDQHPDGIWLVELASLSDPGLVPQVIASTLGVREEPARALRATLVDHVQGKHMLIVLDNCEHLVSACAEIVDAIGRTSQHVRMLVSSREPLGVAGEVLLRLPPLAVPAAPTSSADRVNESEAVRLFVDRVKAVKAEFAITDDNASAVAEICRRLDGIPLAIELAATRVKALSVRQIAAHLNERFRLLTGGHRTALPRHQTLRGLIDWSYELLAEAERAVFRRLSVFAGGWTLEAAQAVCPGEGIDSFDVIDLVSRLLEKSIVVMEEQGTDTRYRMLETIRQYGLEKLAETTEGDRIRDRHRDFYLGFVEDAQRRLQGAEQVVWLTRVEADHDNLRAAFRRSLDQRSIETALRFGAALCPFWDTRGHLTEALEWLEELHGRADAHSGDEWTRAGRIARVRALDGAAHIFARRSELGKVRDLMTQSLGLWRELNDRNGLAEALNYLGDHLALMGDRRQARQAVEESLVLFRELSDLRGIAHALNNLADIVDADGDEDHAQRLLEESVPLFRRTGDTRGLAHALDNLGGIRVRRGQYADAEVLYRESFRLAEELNDWHAIATALRSLGLVAHHRGDQAGASAFYEDSVHRFRSMNDKVCLARSLIGYALASYEGGHAGRAETLGGEGVTLLREAEANAELAKLLIALGRAALEHRHVDRAHRFLLDSLELHGDLKDAAGVTASLAALASVAHRRRQPLVVATLMGAVTALRQQARIPLSSVERDGEEVAIAHARADVDEGAFEAAWRRGATMHLDQVLPARIAQTLRAFA